MPTVGRLYMRKDQMPEGEAFRTKPELAVEALRRCAKFTRRGGATRGPHLAIFDGAYAVSSVVEPLISPSKGQPRIEWLTRLRHDSRLYQSPASRQPGQMGRPRRWGPRLPAPKDAERWPCPWREGKGLVYGKMRRIRYKKLYCQWHPAGPDARVHAFVFQAEGYKKPWHLVSSDLRLQAEQVLGFYAARFAQEDAHRDLKQHLGLGASQGRLKKRSASHLAAQAHRHDAASEFWGRLWTWHTGAPGGASLPGTNTNGAALCVTSNACSQRAQRSFRNSTGTARPSKNWPGCP